MRGLDLTQRKQYLKLNLVANGRNARFSAGLICLTARSTRNTDAADNRAACLDQDATANYDHAR